MKPDAQIRFFSLSLSGQPIMPAIQASHATMEIRRGTIRVLTQTLLSTAARQALSWQPTRFDLKSIIEDAWKWECKDRPASLVEPHQLQA
jgi:hypothetical protein